METCRRDVQTEAPPAHAQVMPSLLCVVTVAVFAAAAGLAGAILFLQEMDSQEVKRIARVLDAERVCYPACVIRGSVPMRGVELFALPFNLFSASRSGGD